MFSVEADQAAGLRRLMAQTSGRIINLISVDTVNTSTTLWAEHLAATLQTVNCRVLLIQASTNHPTLTSPMTTPPIFTLGEQPSLLEVAQKQASLTQAIRPRYGFDMVGLTQKGQLTHALSSNLKQQLEAIVVQLAQEYDLILVNTRLAEMECLPLEMLHAHEMVIEMTQHEQAIQATYACIKRLCSQYGNRPIGIVMTQSQENRAKLMFNSLSQVTQQFVGVPLTLLGAIPDDEAIKKAQHLGRSVIDAFPRAPTTSALKRLAESLTQFSVSHLEMAVA